jgi:hypothetical protein
MVDREKRMVDVFAIKGWWMVLRAEGEDSVEKSDAEDSHRRSCGEFDRVVVIRKYLFTNKEGVGGILETYMQMIIILLCEHHTWFGNCAGTNTRKLGARGSEEVRT